MGNGGMFNGDGTKEELKVPEVNTIKNAVKKVEKKQKVKESLFDLDDENGIWGSGEEDKKEEIKAPAINKIKKTEKKKKGKPEVKKKHV